MIQRRGFLAGCLAVLASPLAWFRSKRNRPKYDLTLSQIDEFMEMASRERSSQMCRQSKEIDKIIARPKWEILTTYSRIKELDKLLASNNDKRL